MTTEVLKSFGTLQLELEQAKTSLKDVDENIKKLIGRDPSENQPRNTVKRQTNHGEDLRGRVRGHNNPTFTNTRNKITYENDEPSTKKRNLDSSVFKRLSERTRHFDEDNTDVSGKQLQSKVTVTPKEIPSRQDVLAAQGADEKSKARNKRMFGALLGTLQKFRQEETKLKPKEEKRAQVEKKLEEQQIREREELKKERQDLFQSRKRKQAEIRMIELKMTRMKEYTEWEERQKPLMNFIQTKAKPHIFYLPRVLNEESKKLLQTCKQNTEKMIDRKRQDVYEDLQAIEQRMKRNFNRQQSGNEGEKQEKDGGENDEQENDEEHDDPVETEHENKDTTETQETPGNGTSEVTEPPSSAMEVDGETENNVTENEEKPAKDTEESTEKEKTDVGES